jgi:hypothetical protein
MANRRSKTIKGLDRNHDGVQNHKRAITTKKWFEITKGPSQLGIENKKMRRGFEITKLRMSQQQKDSKSWRTIITRKEFEIIRGPSQLGRGLKSQLEPS